MVAWEQTPQRSIQYLRLSSSLILFCHHKWRERMSMFSLKFLPVTFLQTVQQYKCEQPVHKKQEGPFTRLISYITLHHDKPTKPLVSPMPQPFTSQVPIPGIGRATHAGLHNEIRVRRTPSWWPSTSGGWQKHGKGGKEEKRRMNCEGPRLSNQCFVETVRMSWGGWTGWPHSAWFEEKHAKSPKLDKGCHSNTSPHKISRESTESVRQCDRMCIVAVRVHACRSN